MSKLHGEQSWASMRPHALHGWRDLLEDDFDAVQAMRHDREIRQRRMRDLARRDRRARTGDFELDV